MPTSYRLLRNQWTSVRVSKAGNYGAAAVLWFTLSVSFFNEFVRAFSQGQRLRAFWLVANAGASLSCHVAAALAFLCACWDQSWLSSRVNSSELEWVYVYVLIPLHFQLARVSPLGTGPTYSTLYCFHVNFGTLVGFPLSRMLAGWAVLTPLFAHWDFVQWRSSLTVQLYGWRLLAAGFRREAGLLLASLSSMLLIQLACGPALCRPADVAAPAKPAEGAANAPGPACAHKFTAASQLRQPGEGSGRSSSAARRLAASWLRAADALDRRFYATGSAMLRSVPLGALVLVACMPYVLCLFVLSCWRIGVYGDTAVESQFPPTQMMLGLLASFMVGRTDLQDLLRRMAAAEEVLSDLVPRHVAAALLRAPKQPGGAGGAGAGGPAGGAGGNVLGSGKDAVSAGNGAARASGGAGSQLFSRNSTCSVSGPLSGLALAPAPSSFDGLVPQGAASTARPADGGEAAAAAEEPPIAEWHEEVTVLFADIRGFTEMAQLVEPFEVMQFLNRLYHRFDMLVLNMPHIYKVETIGDCYMCASGLLQPDADHAGSMLQFAAAMVRAAEEVALPHSGQPVQLRIGLHSGRVMSGVVGSIRKRYCLFGDTVNTASRLETTGLPGRIHISAATHLLALRSPAAEGAFVFEAREPIDVKGKGRMQTYFATPC